MPIPLREDFNAARCRAAAKSSKDGSQARRLLAIAAIDEGGTRTEAAKTGGVIGLHEGAARVTLTARLDQDHVLDGERLDNELHAT